MRVLVIPEDFRKDQYVLKPLIVALLEEIGCKRPRVRVCQNPLLQGISQALRWERIERIISQYGPMIDLFLLCVDRDGEQGRRAALDSIENRVSSLSPPSCLFAENAWQEIEVWVLAGLRDLPGDWRWWDVRQERNPKEAYFMPYATSRRLDREPDEGRKQLAEEAARNYTRVRQLCPEDIASLEGRIREWLKSRTDHMVS